MDTIQELEHWVEFRSKIRNRVERTRVRRIIEKLKKEFLALKAKTPMDLLNEYKKYKKGKKLDPVVYSAPAIKSVVTLKTKSTSHKE